MDMGQVTKRARDSNGNPLVTANTNTVHITRQYIVNFSDLDKADLAANVIATNMYAQFEPDGKQYLLLDSIIYFRLSTTALCYADQNTTKKEKTYYRRSTAGWKLYFQWKDGSKSCTKLSDLKESHPIETAKYSVDQ